MLLSIACFLHGSAVRWHRLTWSGQAGSCPCPIMLNCPGPPLFVHIINTTCMYTHHSMVNEAFAILAQHIRPFQTCYGIRSLTGNHLHIAADRLLHICWCAAGIAPNASYSGISARHGQSKSAQAYLLLLSRDLG